MGAVIYGLGGRSRLRKEPQRDDEGNDGITIMGDQPVPVPTSRRPMGRRGATVKEFAWVQTHGKSVFVLFPLPRTTSRTFP